jgi:hypothetical protein
LRRISAIESKNIKKLQTKKKPLDENGLLHDNPVKTGLKRNVMYSGYPYFLAGKIGFSCYRKNGNR